MKQNWNFTTGAELLALCGEGRSIPEVMIAREEALTGLAREEILLGMEENLAVMRQSTAHGLEKGLRSMGGLVKGDARKVMEYAKGDTLCGGSVCRAVAFSMATVECNACMGKIVAAPTAGASGILPGVLLSCAENRGWGEEALASALLVAAAVGAIIARNATTAGADGGCQAETGSAAAMAGAALVYLMGGSADVSLQAAAIALKNVMGLVCDPIAGLVEAPCVKRNALGAGNAMLSADLALAGVRSVVPFDEVVECMGRVGRQLPAELRETAQGGLAATPTGRRIAREMSGGEGQPGDQGVPDQAGGM